MQVASKESTMPGLYDDTIPIGELSERTGVSVRALRYYEQNDLLNAVRTRAGHRRFPLADIESVRRIRLLLDAGLPPLAVVSQVIPLLPGRRRTTARLRQRLPSRSHGDRPGAHGSTRRAAGGYDPSPSAARRRIDGAPTYCSASV